MSFQKMSGGLSRRLALTRVNIYSGSDVIITTTNMSEATLRLDMLVPDQEYTLMATAVSAAGESSKSDPVLASLDPVKSCQDVGCIEPYASCPTGEDTCKCTRALASTHINMQVALARVLASSCKLLKRSVHCLTTLPHGLVAQRQRFDCS